MILPKEAAEMRHEPSHYLETNRVVYDLFDVVRQMISACCSYDTKTQPPLLIILTSLHYKLSIALSFSRDRVNDKYFCEE